MAAYCGGPTRDSRRVLRCRWRRGSDVVDRSGASRRAVGAPRSRVTGSTGTAVRSGNRARLATMDGRHPIRRWLGRGRRGRRMGRRGWQNHCNAPLVAYANWSTTPRRRAGSPSQRVPSPPAQEPPCSSGRVEKRLAVSRSVRDHGPSRPLLRNGSVRVQQATEHATTRWSRNCGAVSFGT